MVFYASVMRFFNVIAVFSAFVTACFVLPAHADVVSPHFAGDSNEHAGTHLHESAQDHEFMSADDFAGSVHGDEFSPRGDIAGQLAGSAASLRAIIDSVGEIRRDLKNGELYQIRVLGGGRERLALAPFCLLTGENSTSCIPMTAGELPIVVLQDQAAGDDSAMLYIVESVIPREDCFFGVFCRSVREFLVFNPETGRTVLFQTSFRRLR